MCPALAGRSSATAPPGKPLSAIFVPGAETDILHIITEINVYVQMARSVMNGSAVKGVVTDDNQGLIWLGIKEDFSEEVTFCRDLKDGPK